ncbi:MAG: ABC transporter permease [Candidatus Bathyarchaeota archaeon]|nr:ABC transporter permease [Candidatus Bathyarchaeota archaeon]
MSETFFAVNDIFRRKLQTSLTIATLTLSVASTLFLLFFSERIGFGIASEAKETLTFGLSMIFSQFLLFLSVLIFVVGAVVTSFIVFLMMKQRTRDFGLIKAAGCPNNLVVGYFMAELLIVVCAGCIFGAVIGITVDFAVANVFAYPLHQKPPNLLLLPLVFVVFFVIAVVFGAKPILAAAKLPPINALSPVQYFGVGPECAFKPLSRFRLTLRLASRSLTRRQAASVRIVVLLSAVFVLLTVAIYGGIIASDTTLSWIDDAGGRDVIAIAHSEMATQYRLLLSKFAGAAEDAEFNYVDEKLAVPDGVMQHLAATPEIVTIDARLVLNELVREMSGYKIDPETLATLPVGDNRTGTSLIVGIDPEKALTKGFMKGCALNSSDSQQAVIGDTLAEALFSPDLSADPPISRSDPMLQNVVVREKIFDIVGVAVDPINNGNVTYVPLKTLQKVTGTSHVNVVFVKFTPSVDLAATLTQLRAAIQDIASDFTVFELNEVLQENKAFIGSFWSTVLLLPLFTLASAALCLIGYMMLAVDEQRQEFAILRAVGVKPKTVTAVLAVQNLLVLLASCAAGVSLGVIIGLMVLMPQPIATTFGVLLVAAWLLAAVLGMFFISLYPALKFATRPLLEIMG